MIKIEDLNFKFDNEIIFKNTDLEILNNRITVITGANGAGKSTLLKIITNNIQTNCKIQNTFKNIFYLPQNPYYPKDISTFDYLSSVFYKNNWKWFLDKNEKEKVNNTLKKVGLFDKKDLNIENLSAGEIQKANIALGLLSGADLFLLDEPASNMDLINEIKILTMLKKLAEDGITSVLIMHNLNIAANFGDDFIGIKKGEKIIRKNRNDFFKKDILKEIYGIDFEIVNSDGKIYVQILG